ncbi:DUF1127 domain-containing protein [Roseibium sp. M-1]
MSSIRTISGQPVSRLPAAGALLSFLFRNIRNWYLTRRTRRQLLELSDAALEDLGLTRDAAVAEAIRPFWDTESRRKGRF